MFDIYFQVTISPFSSGPAPNIFFFAKEFPEETHFLRSLFVQCDKLIEGYKSLSNICLFPSQLYTFHFFLFTSVVCLSPLLSRRFSCLILSSYLIPLHLTKIKSIEITSESKSFESPWIAGTERDQNYIHTKMNPQCYTTLMRTRTCEGEVTS